MINVGEATINKEASELTAKQARKLMEKAKQRRYRSILDKIRECAENQESSLHIGLPKLTDYDIDKLEYLGYDIEFYDYEAVGFSAIIRW